MNNINDLKSLELTVGDVFSKNARLKARNVNVFYGNNKAIDNVTIDIGSKEVISFIGPSGCGKSTFLRCFNRMNDTIDSCVVQGEITIDDENIYDKKIDVVPLRARIGMVFQKPNPFPKTIKENPKFIKRLSEKCPANRIGYPDDLKGAVALLCSDAGSFITGQNILVDGGLSVW